MSNRDKVIYDIGRCTCNVPDACRDCSHYTGKVGFECMENLLTDALALLKEQDAVVAHWDDDTGHWIEGDRNGIDPHTRTTGEMIDTFRCSWCGFYQYWKTPFCPNCGAKMEGR